ncbi:MAG: AAA family ATPase [Candidatus Pacearchaeota archaeon]
MIIGITGRIGSGKGEVAKFFLKKNFVYFTLSDIVRKEAIKRGIKINREELQNLGDLIRKEEGSGALVKKLLNKVQPCKNYIIDGIRNPGEINVLRKLKGFYLIAVDAPQKIRFQRVLRRAKESDPKNWNDFLRVDERDFYDKSNPLGQQVASCMKMADFIIINDNSIKELRNNIEKIWKKIKIFEKKKYF